MIPPMSVEEIANFSAVSGVSFDRWKGRSRAPLTFVFALSPNLKTWSESVSSLVVRMLLMNSSND